MRTPDVVNAVSTGFCNLLSTTTAQIAMSAAARQATTKVRMGIPSVLF
jgi:hypothetical protein